MAMIKWGHCPTLKAYTDIAVKDSNMLYFVEETKQLFRGETLYTEAVAMVDDFPAVAAVGKLYVHNTTLEGKVYTGTEWKTVIQAIAHTVEAEDSKPVTGQAVINYVKAEFGTGLNGLVTGISFDPTEKNLKYTVKNGEEQSVAIDGFVTGASYDGGSGKLTFTVEGGEAIEINLPKENFVKSGRYDTETKEIVLVLQDDTEVKIPAAELVDTYTGIETDTASVTVSESNQISANVKVSAEGGNALQKKSDGLFVAPTDISNKMDKVAGERANEILVSTEDGSAALSGKVVGGSTLSESPNENTLATEMAVEAIRAALQGNVDSKVDKSSIATAIGTSAEATDDKVASQKAVALEIEKVNAAKVDKSAVVVSVNAEGASADKVASEKAIVDLLSWVTINEAVEE